MLLVRPMTPALRPLVRGKGMPKAPPDEEMKTKPVALFLHDTVGRLGSGRSCRRDVRYHAASCPLGSRQMASSRKCPALLTTVSSRPKCVSAVCTIAARRQGLQRSRARTPHRLPQNGSPRQPDRQPSCPPLPVHGRAEVIDDDRSASLGQIKSKVPPNTAACASHYRYLASRNRSL